MKLSKWLFPGMHIKRWMLVALLGLLLLSNGIGLLAGHWSPIEIRVPIVVDLILIVSGLFLIGVGLRNWVHSIVSALLPEEEGRLVEILDRRRRSGRGSRIVAIGGGSGLSSLLRGLKDLSSNVVAVVTVSDDGGSSGILRRELGVLPPGDIRNCLVALADTEPLLLDLFQYRFAEGHGLEGHSFGNLYLAAMTQVTGDFLTAVRESSKVLAIRGRVLPATLESAVLCAELEDGTIVEGESRVGRSRSPIKRVFFKSPSPKGLDEACAAIREADAIIFGPGSLYTSVIPNLLVEGVLDAVRESRGLKIHICNVMTQPGETTGYSASKHVSVLLGYLGSGVIDHVVVNEEIPEEVLLGRYREEGGAPVEPDIEEIERIGIRTCVGQFLAGGPLIRHDPAKLAAAIRELIAEEEGRPFGSPNGGFSGWLGFSLNGETLPSAPGRLESSAPGRAGGRRSSGPPGSSR